MKIRKMVKKAMAAGILALMACTSMSAMAEPEWVRVGNPIHNFKKSAVSSFEQVCEQYERYYVPGDTCMVTGENCLHFTGKVLDFYQDQVLCEAKNGYGSLTRYPTTIKCLVGVFRHEGSDGLGAFGCYEYREPKPCDAGYMTDRSFLGKVACTNQGYREVCAWMDGVIDPEARDIVHSCIERHEYLHIEHEYWKVYNNECFEGFLSNFSETQRYEQEYVANGDSVVCLMRGKKDQCSTSACRDEMDRHIERIENEMTRYESNYCNATGNISSNIITCH